MPLFFNTTAVHRFANKADALRGYRIDSAALQDRIAALVKSDLRRRDGR